MAQAEIILHMRPGDLARFREYLHAGAETALKRIGVHLVAQAKKAFSEQRFGAIQWPERYPNQVGGKLNIAGAVDDLKSGPRIKSRRYDARPAGRDTGEMMRRLTFRVAGGALEVGSDVPYAQKFHAGGISRQPLTRDFFRNLAQFLRTKRGGAKRRARHDGTLGPRGGTPKMLEEIRLAWLFNETYLETKSPPRPFLGFTREILSDITAMMADDLRRFGQ